MKKLLAQVQFLIICTLTVTALACSPTTTTSAEISSPMSDQEKCKEAEARKKESSNFLVPSQKALWDRHWDQINQAEADIEKYCN
ncbi:MAG: hypothetical protein CL886_06290 [Dehalococcoidia bacterium]|nr:hypothetical protein [Dehalococcoidia bacterium]|tara:strand:+ start:7324 stop:7578 length:255 start_codon:yes stop_codon:yes gene_type:complete